MVDRAHLLSSIARADWARIGTEKKGGIASPAFSLYSKNSIAVADYKDLEKMIDFCHETNNAIFQSLPMNCTGFNFAPYAAESGFALDALYLSLKNVKGLNYNFDSEINQSKFQFPIEVGPDGANRTNYKVIHSKLDLAYKMFKSRDWNNEFSFQEFKGQSAKYWLNDYVLYRALKEVNGGKSWQDWENKFKYRDENALREFSILNADKLEFHRWLQWQLFTQAKGLKEYANKKGVLIMGDLPFLPSRDSADVWVGTNRERRNEGSDYFDLNLQAGALPDMYFADGQRWGNPVPVWENMEKDDFAYVRQKRRYASNFYNIERKDHEIGQFRLCVNRLDATHNRNGWFVPPGTIDDEESERRWQSHGAMLIRTQIEDPESRMLYTSEGLGSPPKYMRETLLNSGVPDIDVQRWTKKGSEFTEPRWLGISTTSTHDCTLLPAWWETEAGTIDEGMFLNLCVNAGVSSDQIKDRLFDPETSSNGRLRWRKGLTGTEAEINAMVQLKEEFANTRNERAEFLRSIGLNMDPEANASIGLVATALEKDSFGPAIFNIPSIFDVLAVRQEGLDLAKVHRINRPGMVLPVNWNLMTHISLDDINSDDVLINYLRELNIESGRALSI